jgi:hypothetical protein
MAWFQPIPEVSSHTSPYLNCPKHRGWDKMVKRYDVFVRYTVADHQNNATNVEWACFFEVLCYKWCLLVEIIGVCAGWLSCRWNRFQFLSTFLYTSSQVSSLPICPIMFVKLFPSYYLYSKWDSWLSCWNARMVFGIVLPFRLNRSVQLW